MADLLHVGDRSFDPDDLTFAEKRNVRRLIRTEVWDRPDEEFSWEEIGEDDVVPATVTVFMRREDPAYTLEQAFALKPRDVYGDEVDEAAVPPTKPASSPRASARKKTSAVPGSRS